MFIISRVKVLGKEGPGQILPPLIEVTYAELTQAQILQNEAVSISLAVDWEMEHTSIYGVQVRKPPGARKNTVTLTCCSGGSRCPRGDGSCLGRSGCLEPK